MQDNFALHYGERRAKERGYTGFQMVYREFVLPEQGVLNFLAYNEIWLITFVEQGLIVKSEYGQYQSNATKDIIENTYEHADRIEITNTQKEQRTIRFLQVILKTKADDIQI